MKVLSTEGLTNKMYEGYLINDWGFYFLVTSEGRQPVRVGTERGNYKQLFIPTPYHKGDIPIREHRLLAFNFCEHPEGMDASNYSDYHVHHLDGNKENNRVDNLQILHSSEHMALTAKERSYTVTATTLHDNKVYTFSGLEAAAKFCNSSPSKISKYRNGGILTGKGVYIKTSTS